MNGRLGLFSVCLGLNFAACATPSPAVAPQPQAAPPAEKPPASAATSKGAGWSSMNFGERKKYMAEVVYPEMQALFQDFAPAEFAGSNDAGEPKFRCQTCHGENMGQVKFTMPNNLHPLPAPNPVPAAMEYDADATKFMLEKVVPKMAELLGQAPRSSEKPDGFGCFGCHQKE